MLFKICFILIFISVKNIQIEGFSCFACQTTLDDQTCLENPESVNSGIISTDCGDSGWCTIYRLELTNIPGEVKLFSRGCSRKRPIHENNVETNSLYTAYHRSCQFHLCNNGTATEPGVGGGLRPEEGRILYVSGSENPRSLKNSILLSFLSFYSTCLIYYK